MSEPALTIDEVKAVLDTKQFPRVTEEAIKAKIDRVEYVRFDITTIAFIIMKNGFRFMGFSTPASPGNYDQAVGERYAYDNAFRQIWTHEGYLLREKLSRQSVSPSLLLGSPAFPGLASYQSVKIVQAGEIIEVVPAGCYVRDAYGTAVLLIYQDKMTERYQPQVGDFWVIYADGYASISPRDAFLEGYVEQSAK